MKVGKDLGLFVLPLMVTGCSDAFFLFQIESLQRIEHTALPLA